MAIFGFFKTEEEKQEELRKKQEAEQEEQRKREEAEKAEAAAKAEAELQKNRELRAFKREQDAESLSEYSLQMRRGSYRQWRSYNKLKSENKLPPTQPQGDKRTLLNYFPESDVVFCAVEEDDNYESITHYITTESDLEKSLNTFEQSGRLRLFIEAMRSGSLIHKLILDAEENDQYLEFLYYINGDLVIRHTDGAIPVKLIEDGEWVHFVTGARASPKDEVVTHIEKLST